MMGAFVLFVSRALERPEGIDNDNIFHESVTNRGWIGVALGALLTGLYIVIYFGTNIHLAKDYTMQQFFQTHVYSLVQPLSDLLRGTVDAKGKAIVADNWFFYGVLYTTAVLIFGVRMLFKYRHNRYHMLRTLSVMFFQLGFGFLIPGLLQLFHQPEFYFSYFWPLKTPVSMARDRLALAG